MQWWQLLAITDGRFVTLCPSLSRILVKIHVEPQICWHRKPSISKSEDTKPFQQMKENLSLASYISSCLRLTFGSSEISKATYLASKSLLALESTEKDEKNSKCIISSDSKLERLQKGKSAPQNVGTHNPEIIRAWSVSAVTIHFFG